MVSGILKSKRMHRLIIACMVALAVTAPYDAQAQGPGEEPSPAFFTAFHGHLETLAAHDRVVGGQGLEQAVAHAVAVLEGHGLATTVDRYPLYVPVYEPHTITGPDGFAAALHPLPPNGPILSVAGPDGLSGPLQDAGDGSLAALEGQSWEGAIAVVTAARTADWLRPFDFGAKAVIFAAGAVPGAAAGEEVVSPFESPYLQLAADLPRFWAEPQDALRLRQLAAGGAQVTIQGDGRWEPVAIPHVTAVIPGLSDDVVVLHADLDRNEGLGGEVLAASEAVPAAFLLALAEEWAGTAPARTVIISLGSGSSRGFASLREWVAVQEATEVAVLLGLDWADGGEGLALVVEGDLNTDRFRNEPRFGDAAMQPRARTIRGLATALGIPLENFVTGSVIRTEDFRNLLGRSPAFPSEVTRAQGWPALTITTYGDARPGRGTTGDRLEFLEQHVLQQRAGELHRLLGRVVAVPELPPLSPQPLRSYIDVEVSLPDGLTAGGSEPAVWVGVTPGPADRQVVPAPGQALLPPGQLPWVLSAGEEGAARFVGISAGSLAEAYLLADGRTPVASRRAYAPDRQTFLDLYASRLVTLTGWPEELGEAAVLDPVTGVPLVPHDLDARETVAVLQAPAEAAARIFREAQTALPARGIQQAPSFVLELAPPGPGEPRHGRLHRTDLAMALGVQADYRATADALRDARARDPLMEGYFNLVGRELADAETAAHAGEILHFQRRLVRGQELLATAAERLGQVQRDASLSFVLFVALALPAALTLTTVLGLGRNRPTRLGATALIFLVLYLVARTLHPGASVGIALPERLLAVAVLALVALVVAVRYFHRFERWAADRLRRMARVREMDRYTLVRAAMDLGAVQLGRRRLRSVLTITAMSLFVFALVGISGLAPELRGIPFQVRGEPAYQGVYVATGLGQPDSLVPRVADEVASWSPDFEQPLLFRWRIAERPDMEPLVPGPDPDLRPRYEAVGAGDRTIEATAMVGLDAGFGPLLDLDRQIVAGRWLRDDAPELVLPRALAANLAGGTSDEALGMTVTVYLVEVRQVPGSWVEQAGPPTEVTVVGIIDETAWDATRGLDGSLARARNINADRTLLVSAPVAEAQGLPIRGVAAASPVPPDLEHLSQEAAGLPYSIWVGHGEDRYALGNLRVVAGQMALPLAVLLVLGVLIVANTMLGATYEREGELRQFHVVGMAPDHVRILLMTESVLVGAVAVVAGWTLTMAAGVLLQGLEGFQGMALNAGALNITLLLLAVLATCALTAVIPSRRAAEQVAPVDKEAELAATGDRIETGLPFQVEPAAVPGLWAFLWPGFNPHETHSDVYEVHYLGWVEDHDETGLPALEMTVMLHPREAGVNQQVLLYVNPEPTNEDDDGLQVRATIIRQTGPAAAWKRLNVRFLSEVRKELLAWEVVKEKERERYALRARDIATNTPQAWLS